jgi:superfamily II DNA or RNA helicase
VQVPTRNPVSESVLQDKTGEFSAPKMYTYLANNEERNRKILNQIHSALKKDRKILVLAHSKAHPKILHDMFIDSERMKGYTAGVVTGDTSGAERTSIIKESDVSFATFQVAKEGLDVAELDTLIFATPFKSWGAFQQGKGRVERQFRDKKEPLVLVIDDTYIGASTSMCRALKRGITQHGLSFKAIEG